MTLLLLCFLNGSVKIIIDNMNVYCNIYYRQEVQMKESVYKSYDDLPLFLNAKTVAKVLGVSPSSGYELLHDPGFPVMRVGNRMVVPKEQFIQWVSDHTGGGT